MTAPQDQPLDEIQWRAPGLLYSMSGVHSNSVLPYFSHSPFFDPTSNNATIMNQAMHNPNMFYLIETREAFEGRLKSMNGLEFIVAQEPAEMAPGTGTGVWVIRKQTRRKRDMGQEDELTVHATYFVVGENIYMAPAVGDVIGTRLLTVASSLKKFINTASSLTKFSPALGNTYLPPTSSRPKADSQLSQASKEVTPMPDSIGTEAKKSQSTSKNSYLQTRLLDESFSLTLRYTDEYMDKNPITGQPGDFHLSTTGRTEKDRLAVPGKGAPGTPSALSTPDPKTAELPGKKGIKADKSPKPSTTPKIKRRKSKITSGNASSS